MLLKLLLILPVQLFTEKCHNLVTIISLLEYENSSPSLSCCSCSLFRFPTGLTLRGHVCSLLTVVPPPASPQGSLNEKNTITIYQKLTPPSLLWGCSCRPGNMPELCNLPLLRPVDQNSTCVIFFRLANETIVTTSTENAFTLILFKLFVE